MSFGRTTKIILGISVAVAVLAIYQIFLEYKYLQGGILLAYVGVVIVGTSRLLRPSTGSGRTDEMVLPSPQPSPPSTTLRTGSRGKGEEIILNIIREKGPSEAGGFVASNGAFTKFVGAAFGRDGKKRKLIKFMTQIAISF